MLCLHYIRSFYGFPDSRKSEAWNGRTHRVQEGHTIKSEMATTDWEKKLHTLSNQLLLFHIYRSTRCIRTMQATPTHINTSSTQH